MVGAQFPCLAVSAGFEFNFEVEKASCTGMPSSRCSGVLRPVWPDNAVIMVGYFFFFLSRHHILRCPPQREGNHG